MTKKIYLKVWVFCFVFVFILNIKQASAQITYLGSQFYENLYMANPAMAGIEEGILLNLTYRNQWRTMEGSPVSQAFTAEYGSGKVGTGVNIYNDKAGLYNRLRAVGTYAYHLPLNDRNQFMHFGFSMGVSHNTINQNKVVGDGNDHLIDDYRRKPYLVGDVGIAFTSDEITVQAAIPNMKKYFEKDEREIIDRAVYLVAFSYKIKLEAEGVTLEPKLSYRGTTGTDDIIDIGSNINFQEGVFTVMGMYHSNKSFTTGFGVNVDRFTINGYYTSQWTELSNSLGGNFEINIRARLFN